MSQTRSQKAAQHRRDHYNDAPERSRRNLRTALAADVVARLGHDAGMAGRRGHVVEIRGGAVARVDWDGEDCVRSIPWKNLQTL